MKKYNKDIGDYGECIVKNYLIENGYKIIKCNYRCPFGEIDIISRKDDIISFVEVKSRYDFKYGMPVEAVDTRKRDKIRKVCKWFIMKTGIRNVYFRFDIVSVYFDNNDSYKIEIIENAF